VDPHRQRALGLRAAVHGRDAPQGRGVSGSVLPRDRQGLLVRGLQPVIGRASAGELYAVPHGLRHEAEGEACLAVEEV